MARTRGLFSFSKQKTKLNCQVFFFVCSLKLQEVETFFLFACSHQRFLVLNNCSEKKKESYFEQFWSHLTCINSLVKPNKKKKESCFNFFSCIINPSNKMPESKKRKRKIKRFVCLQLFCCFQSQMSDLEKKKSGFETFFFVSI